MFLVPPQFPVTCYHTFCKMEMKAQDIPNECITLNTFLLESNTYIVLVTFLCFLKLCLKNEQRCFLISARLGEGIVSRLITLRSSTHVHLALSFPPLSSPTYCTNKCPPWQHFDAVGALTLALTFDHVALTLKRRNKYILENGSSDLKQIHIM
jgi:hypothetical protein